jgi:hypothetical protein
MLRIDCTIIYAEPLSTTEGAFFCYVRSEMRRQPNTGRRDGLLQALLRREKQIVTGVKFA